MLCFTINDTKKFMTVLLKGTVFHDFCIRNLEITTFASFEISGNRNADFYTLSEQENLEGKFCTWKELQPYAFDIIKGKKLPKNIKIIFSLPEKELEQFENASALFLNIQFENSKITCTTGCSETTFSMDKSLVYNWDQWILTYFRQHMIGIELQQ